MSEDDDMKAYGYEGEIIAVLIPKEKQELKKPGRFKVVILNDDYTPMEFVVGVLTMFFNKTIDDATTNEISGAVVSLTTILRVTTLCLLLISKAVIVCG